MHASRHSLRGSHAVERAVASIKQWADALAVHPTHPPTHHSFTNVRHSHHRVKRCETEVDVTDIFNVRDPKLPIAHFTSRGSSSATRLVG